MKTKTSVILVFVLFLLLATGLIITEGKDPLKIRRHQNNSIELLGNLRSELSYYPESHDFGDKHEGEVDSTTFEIWNSGCCACTLIYELTWDCSWVDVHPTEGTSNCEHDTIFVDIDTTGLVPGPYICEILILSNWGDGVFTVTVNILSEDFTNITVYEAWDLLNDTSNGIQIPIDVRTDGEWVDEHIDTPFPENPKHHPDLHHSNDTQLQEFKALYNGREIILYCRSGYRSFVATNLLIDNDFNGTIYNMLGGIIAWKAAGYPTIGNQQPDKPTINGPPSGKPGEEYSYTFVATDPDSDVLFYCVNWSDDTGEIVVGPYESGKEIILNHSWDEKGNYIIKAKAIDRYGNESEWSYFEVTMPRNRATYNSLFLKLLEQFPILERLLSLIRV